ncbi:iron ABC transporter permease [Microbacterium sp. LWH11-1.2]|uniref:ABC transporter permease n=1 Tax=unclassified Microbacterium TaxID=2609290 RepID=UPI0031386F47
MNSLPLPQQETATATLVRTRRSRRIHVTAHRSAGVWLVLAIVLACLTLLLGLPVGKLLLAGASADGLAAITAVVVGSDARALQNSLLLGLCVGIIGTAVGFITAYAQVFLEFPGKRLLHWLTLLPLISPPFAAATAIITLFGRRGLISYQLFGIELDIYGLPGLIIVIAMTFTPLAYMNIRGMMENLDPSMFEAAASLGLSELRTLFRVTIPMVVPALLTSFLILFVEALADLANPLVIGGDFRVLASQIYFAIAGSGDIAKAAGLAVVLLVPSLLVFVIQKYWAGKKSVITVSGKPAGAFRPIRSRSVRMPVLILASLWMALVVIVFGTILVGGFVSILGVNNTFTLDHYEFVWRLGADAMQTTLLMTLVAAPIAAALAVLIAWLVVRHFQRFGRVLDFVGMLGSAIPGTVLGLGFALAYSQPTYFLGATVLPALAGGLAVGGGSAAIIMVFIARGIPTGQQASISGLKQINPQVDEAAISLGAGQLATFVRVSLPLITPAIVTAVTYAITKSMTTITAIIFITTPQTKVMTSQILDEVDAGRFGNAFAYCTVLIAMVLVILTLTTLLLRRLNRSKRTKQ